MATVYPLATLGVTISATGISAPPYSDIYESLRASVGGIYGSDVYIDPDSQDGQLLAIVARAVADTNDRCIDIYNSYAPSTAQGAALSNNVKLNGLARNSSSSSSVPLNVGGQIGSIISNGVASDSNGVRWLLPASVTIPPAGVILVTATAEDAGATLAEVGTITKIVNPQLGWQTVTNPSAATAGDPVESDATLRQRQTTSTALPSRTVLDGIVGGVLSLPGVTNVKGYENDTDTTDANGLPPHSTALVLQGGNAAAIAQTYLNKKTPGAFTYGTTAVPAVSSTGILYTIRYFIATPTPIKVAITIQGRTGYTTTIGNQIKQALADYINGLDIGQRIDLGKLYLPAQFYGGAGSETFDVNVLLIAVSPGTPVASDITIAFNARATCALSDIVLTVT